MLRVKTLSAHIFLVPGALYTYTMYVLFDLSEFLHYDSFLVRRIKIEDDQLICVLLCLLQAIFRLLGIVSKIGHVPENRFLHGSRHLPCIGTLKPEGIRKLAGRSLND